MFYVPRYFTNFGHLENQIWMHRAWDVLICICIALIHVLILSVLISEATLYAHTFMDWIIWISSSRPILFSSSFYCLIKIKGTKAQGFFHHVRSVTLWLYIAHDFIFHSLPLDKCILASLASFLLFFISPFSFFSSTMCASYSKGS